jgi:hypothetical protein
MRLFAFLSLGFIALASIDWLGGSLLGDYQVTSEGQLPADDWQVVKSSCETDLVVFSLWSVSLEDGGGQKDHGFYVLAG